MWWCHRSPLIPHDLKNILWQSSNCCEKFTTIQNKKHEERFRILLENKEFQDTDREATKVEDFDDITEDTAAVRVKVKEVDDPEEPDEGNIISTVENKNDLFLK